MINRDKLQHILEYAKQQRHIGLHCKVPPEDMVEIVEMAMLQGAEAVTTANKLRDAVETIRSSGIAIDADKIFAERDALNSPVIPDGGEHGFCQRHQDTRLLTHPYKQLLTYPPRPSTYCPKCDPEVAEWVELDKKLRKDN